MDCDAISVSSDSVKSDRPDDIRLSKSAAVSGAGVAAAMTTGVAAGRMTGGRLAVLAMTDKAALAGFFITGAGAGISAAAKTGGGSPAFSVVRSKNGAGVR